MRVPAIDTSTDRTAVALVEDGKVIASRFHEDPLAHGEALAKIVSEIKPSLEKLDLVAIGMGPGPFTGLRSGIAFAQSFALARGISWVGVSSLDALAKQFVGNEFIVHVDARRREVFYWIVILLTFALGTASGDLIAEKIDLGYGKTFLLFVGIVTAILALWKMKLINNILTFWLCYIMTRPLGAASGDFLSQAKSDGGIGLGTEITSITYLILIIGFVTYLHLRKVDVIK